MQAVRPSGALGPTLGINAHNACGTLWDWWSDPGTVKRYDLNGKPTWTTTVAQLAPSTIKFDPINVAVNDVLELEGQCFVRIDVPGTGGHSATILVRLDGSCVAERSPDLGGLYINNVGDTLWVGTWTDSNSPFRRLDPSTWVAMGPVIDLPTQLVMGPDRSLWAWGDRLQKLDLPVGPLPYTPASPLPCTSPSSR